MTRSPASDTTGRILDIRAQGYGPDAPADLALTNATATGEALGYRVQAQRRTRTKQGYLAIRLTTPDGRTLDLAAPQGISPADARTPTSTALSRHVAHAFRDAPTPQQARLAADRIEAVVEAGRHALRIRESGLAARLRIQSAAEGVDHATVLAWRNYFEITQTSDRMSAVEPRTVAWLTGLGFTPDTTRAWFTPNRAPLGDPARIAAGSLTEVRYRATFRDAGWDPQQLRIMEVNTGQPRISTGWARLDARTAMLAVQAGLDHAEATRLVRSGDWDERAIATLIALRSGQDTAPLLLATR